MTLQSEITAELGRSEGEDDLRVPAPKPRIRDKGRVRNLGEVFTPEHIVNEMLDMVDHKTRMIESRFLEPGCGTGNFLVEILRRKLGTVREVSLSQQEIEFNTLLALSSIYGIDIDQENVLESRQRMRDLTFESLNKAKLNSPYTLGYRDSIEYILRTNIVLGDFLNGQHDIYLTEFSVTSEQKLQQRVFRLCDLRRKGLMEKAQPVPVKEKSERCYWELARE